MKKVQLSLKEQFRLWLETEREIDEIIAIVKIPCILSKLDSKLAVVWESARKTLLIQMD